MIVGNLVKIIEPNNFEEWQKDKLAIITDKSDKPNLLLDGTEQYSYELFIFEDNQHHAWFWDNQIEFVKDFFKEYRT